MRACWLRLRPSTAAHLTPVVCVSDTRSYMLVYIREDAMEHVMFPALQHAEFEVPVQPPGHAVAREVEGAFVPPYCYYLGASWRLAWRSHAFVVLMWVWVLGVGCVWLVKLG